MSLLVWLGNEATSNGMSLIIPIRMIWAIHAHGSTSWQRVLLTRRISPSKILKCFANHCKARNYFGRRSLVASFSANRDCIAFKPRTGKLCKRRVSHTSGRKSLASPALTPSSGIDMLITLTKAACDWDCGRTNREQFLNPIARDICTNYSAKPIRPNGLKLPHLHCLSLA